MDSCDIIVYCLSGVLGLEIIALLIVSVCICTGTIEAKLRKKNLRLKDKLREEKTRLEDELRKETQEKEDALKRLSAIMSSRLRDGNPNIADLNDLNRPTKVGEHFSELYDNQWTDAYDAIKNFFENTLTELEIIQILLELVKECFTECKAVSKNQMEKLKENVENITAIITKSDSQLPSYLMQHIKEERKLIAPNHIPAVDMILPRLERNFSSKNRNPKFLDEPPMKAYIQECLKLSWFMVIQDPPMTMILEPASNDYRYFKEYKNRGKFLGYIVWPALLLQEEGELICKGTAEFTSASSSLNSEAELNVRL
ncbi:uncharacterized protein LOC132724767 [Ruditapes philippinarum]|uniref:uncharacterized protein LOC132724767 n=1 Tax=Ruditapes philippinarum TaxID=129788 RepID=UPI00295AAE1A|nr:uncharacterized protein LOC132724767 [Ruditapes philippinarum]XP_060565713.1 uncharacterized protein LOC132724767 [Ruditapes philippinarum]